MTKIALLGAGGKMGVRLATNLMGSRFDVAPVEVAEAGRARLKAATGLDCIEQGQALSPRRRRAPRRAGPAIGEVAHADRARSSTPAPRSSSSTPPPRMPARCPSAPTSPTSSPTPATRRSSTTRPTRRRRPTTSAASRAKQHIVCALMQGPEEHYALCEEVAREIYKPVMRSHRCTVEQIAILEPALSETVGATLALALREATDEAVRRGVPRAGRARLHPRPPQHRARHRLRHLPRGQVLRRRAARHRPGEAADLPRRTGSSASSRPEAVLKSVKDICHPKKPPETSNDQTGRRRMTRLQTPRRRHASSPAPPSPAAAPRPPPSASPSRTSRPSSGWPATAPSPRRCRTPATR